MKIDLKPRDILMFDVGIGIGGVIYFLATRHLPLFSIALMPILAAVAVGIWIIEGEQE